MIEAWSVADVRAAEGPLLAAGEPLMERAAFALATIAGRDIARRRGPRESAVRGTSGQTRGAGRRGRVTGARVVLLVGAGNNGGDTLFAGAHLARRGAQVVAICTTPRVHPEGLAALRAAYGRVVDVSKGTGTPAWSRAIDTAASADVILDGLVGIGATGALRGVAGKLVAEVAAAIGRSGPRNGEDPRVEAGNARAGGNGSGGSDPTIVRVYTLATHPTHATIRTTRPWVIAVDTPSGIGVDDGTVPGPVLPADRTVTFGAVKPGLLLPPATYVAGRRTLVDIGLDFADAPYPGRPAERTMTGPAVGQTALGRPVAVSRYSSATLSISEPAVGQTALGRPAGQTALGPVVGQMVSGRPAEGTWSVGSAERTMSGRPAGRTPTVRTLEPADVAAMWPVPGANDHKYTRGVLGVVAGTPTFPGAAVLAASGAVRTGPGMVRFRGPEAVTRAVIAARPEVVPASGQVQAWLLGSGVPPAGDPEADGAGQHERIRYALAQARGDFAADVVGRRVPAVVDAGALSLLPDICPPHVVLTPHAGELATLLRARGQQNLVRADVAAAPLHWARRAQALTGATVLLKGAATIVVGPGVTYVQDGAPAWLATAGSGDVLAGILGAMLAAHCERVIAEPEFAARVAAAAVVVHGLAGAAANPGGPFAAMDVADAVPRVIADLLAGRVGA